MTQKYSTFLPKLFYILCNISNLLDELQIVFALKIQRGQLKPEEICAGCLGLKKIKDLRLKNDVLRHVLYDLLNTKNLDSKFKVKVSSKISYTTKTHLKTSC